LSSINITKKKSFQSFFVNASESALDLLRKLLVFNPNHRLTVEEALQHKYVEQFSSPEEEMVADHIIEIPMDDNTKFSVKEYRNAIYDDISKKKKEQRKKIQEKYLSQLGVTPEMLEQQKLAKQASAGMASNDTTTTAATSQSHSKSSQNGISHSRSSSNYASKNQSGTSQYEEQKNMTSNVPEKRQVYATASRPESQGGSDSLYQKAKAQAMVKQGSATGTTYTSSTKTTATNSYVNQYSAQTFASSKSGVGSGAGTTGGTKVSQSSGTNLLKKKV
jgi:serine/threonine protein kinase